MEKHQLFSLKKTEEKQLLLDRFYTVGVFKYH